MTAQIRTKPGSRAFSCSSRSEELSARLRQGEHPHDVAPGGGTVHMSPGRPNSRPLLLNGLILPWYVEELFRVMA